MCNLICCKVNVQVILLLNVIFRLSKKDRATDLSRPESLKNSCSGETRIHTHRLLGRCSTIELYTKAGCIGSR